jgi:hypothetical protein
MIGSKPYEKSALAFTLKHYTIFLKEPHPKKFTFDFNLRYMP